MKQLNRFFAWLEARSVWQIGLSYLVGAWVILQVVVHLSEVAGLPPWIGQLVLVAGLAATVSFTIGRHGAERTVALRIHLVARRTAFTLIELLVAMILAGILASIAMFSISAMRVRAMNARAIAEVRTIATEVVRYEMSHGYYPADLAAIDRAGMMDPWGHPYQYLRIKQPPGGGGAHVVAGARKDRFLVPINSDFDLYSMGQDGRSVPPLTASRSRDDLVRANDGGYVGIASGF